MQICDRQQERRGAKPVISKYCYRIRDRRLHDDFQIHLLSVVICLFFIIFFFQM